MSIVAHCGHRKHAWLLWLPVLCWALIAILGPMGAMAADPPPEEPDEYIIVSDDGPAAAKPAEPEPPAALPESDAAADEQAPREMPPPEEDAGDEEDGEAALIDESLLESQVEEVAPIAEAPGEPTLADDESPTDSATPDIAEEDSRDVVSPARSRLTTPAKKAESPLKRAAEPAVAAPQEAVPRPLVEGASFKGVIPGVTTAAEIEDAWGPAREIRKTAAGVQHVHYLKPFKQVIATVTDDTVDTIIIHLDKLFEPAPLARQLTLDDVEPATIYNARGQMLGMAFPERGVLFGFASGSPVRVAQIVLEPINSQPFVTRAEKNFRKKPAEALADADYAVEIDPEYDRAHAIRARVLIEMGRFAEAAKAIEKALSITPDDAEFWLIRIRVAMLRQDYSTAEEHAQALCEDENAPKWVLAHAQLLWGDALAHGPRRDFTAAIEHHTEAIRLAEAASRASAGPVRRAAKELLVDAHLAVANDIAWGNWQQKTTVVPKWLDRAEAFCENVIEKESGDESLRFRVYEQALQAYAGLKKGPDVREIVDALSQLGRELQTAEPTTARREWLSWRLGEALANAMLIAQSRGELDDALKLGKQALEHFEASGELGANWPGRDHVLGRVYYRLGALRAVNQTDHKQAIVWYDKATPLLETPTAPAAAADAGRLGEMFVSMGVSYWETGQREEAVRLTQQGAKCMEAAVADKLLPEVALGIPYGNLASMHAELGDADQAKRFAEMASRLETIRK